MQPRSQKQLRGSIPPLMKAAFAGCSWHPPCCSAATRQLGSATSGTHLVCPRSKEIYVFPLDPMACNGVEAHPGKGRSWVESSTAEELEKDSKRG